MTFLDKISEEGIKNIHPFLHYLRIIYERVIIICPQYPGCLYLCIWDLLLYFDFIPQPEFPQPGA